MPVTSADLSFAMPRHTKILMVMDVVESVRLMEQHQDEFVRRWQELVDQTEHRLLPLYGGRLVKSLGDGLMLEFSDAQSCVLTAFALQNFAAQSHQGRPEDQRIYLRMGAHLAEFVADQRDIYGSDVNLTARISALAGPGETVITAELRDGLTAGLDADIEDLGDCYLKHVAQPVRIYRVGPVGHRPVIEPDHSTRSNLRPTIAVIPFAMRSAEPGHQMLGEALADETIAALSRTSELHVISRLSTTVFRERQLALDDIRNQLGAGYVLSGTCRSMGTELSLFAELIDAKTGHVVWANTLKGKVHGVFAENDELIATLVAAISSTVMSQQLQRARRQSLPTLEGYTLLLGAVGLMHRNSLSDFDRARQVLEHLIERSRRHPIPHAWMAQWHVLRVQQGWSLDAAKEARLALESTKKALDNDPDCALAITAEGFVHTNLLRQLDLGFARYERALEINPNDSMACLLKGTLHAFKGEGELAMAGTEKALALSPLDPLRYFYDSLAATAALSARDYARASELARRSLKANRTHTSTLRALAIAEVLLGHPAEAAKAASDLLQLEPGFTVNGFLRRSPSSLYQTGSIWAEALRAAGVPA